jgi:hypothetical protein
MGFTEILTVVLVILKGTGHLNWSWWLVFAPELFTAAVYLVALACTLVFGVKILKR